MLFMAAPKITVSGVTEWYKNNNLPIVDIHEKSYNKPVKEQAGKERKRRKMKEKIKGLKTWVRDHKKRAAGILVAFLLVIGAGIFGVVGVNSANRAEAENKKTEEIKTAKAETKKETKKKEDQKETEEKKEDQEEKKEETDSKEKDAAGTQETQASETTTQSTGTASAPSSSGNSGGSQTGTTGGQTQTADPAPSQPAAPPAAEEPVHQHVYDVPIWGKEPETAMVPVMICNDCGAYLNADNCWDHIENHAQNGGKGSWTDTYESQPTGNMIPVITGYKCSCGAVQ